MGMVTPVNAVFHRILRIIELTPAPELPVSGYTQRYFKVL